MEFKGYSAVRRGLGELLIESGVINQIDLEHALAVQKEGGHRKRIGEILVNMGQATEQEIAQALSLQMGCSFVALNDYPVDRDMKELLSPSILRRDIMLPISRSPHDPDVIRLAVADPLNSEALDDFFSVTGLHPEVCIALRSDILAQIDAIYGPAAKSSLADAFQDQTVRQATDTDALSDVLSVSNASLVREAIASRSGMLVIAGTDFDRVQQVIHATVSCMDTHSMKVFSIEEKVDSYLPWVNQIQADGRSGLTTSAALSAIIGLGPDVVIADRLIGSDMAQIMIDACTSGCFIMTGLISRIPMNSSDVSVVLDRLGINEDTVDDLTIIAIQ